MKDNSAEETHSKRRIIAAAKDLFHQQGVRATHVNEIVQVSGFSRRAFNRSFRSKQKLAREVVLAYLVEIESARLLLHPKLVSWRDFERSLAQYVTFLNQFNMLRSCPLAIIGNELTEKDDATRQVLSTVFEALTKRMTAFFTKNGEPSLPKR
jgi:TetR/AcrR family transcriptional regulator, transcriptional repressor for nem operon